MIQNSALLEGKTLYAFLCSSNLANTGLDGFEFPEDKEISTITASDLKDKNILDVSGSSLPILAKDYVFHKNQPLFLAVGPVPEQIKLFIKKTKIKYSDAREVEFADCGEPLTKSFGNTEEIFKTAEQNAEDYIIKNSEFHMKRHSASLLSEQKTTCSINGEKIYLKLATQWPYLVRKSVANALNTNIKNVVLDIIPTQNTYDQLVYKPAILAVLAANAASQTGCNIILSEEILSYEPEYDCTCSMVMNLKTKELVATRINMTVNTGAFPVFNEEMKTNIMAGLVSQYSIRAAQYTVQTKCSFNSPSNFFGDLGYSIGVAASEYFISSTLNSLNIPGDEWRKDNTKSGSSPYSELLHCPEIKFFPNTVKKASEKSAFTRKNATYCQNFNDWTFNNTFLNYSRGIGLAGKGGVFGFSSEFRKNNNYSINVTQKSDEKATIYTDLFPEEKTVELWKESVAETLGINPSGVDLSASGNMTGDIGPSTLSRTACSIPQMLISACNEIINMKETQPFPITAAGTSPVSPKNKLYDVNCLGTIVLELHINPVLLVPEIDHITASFKCGRILNEASLRNKINQTISATILEICPDAKMTYNISLNIESNSDKPIGSVSSLTRGLVVSSFMEAISKALKHETDKIPITADDILNIIRKKTPV